MVDCRAGAGGANRRVRAAVVDRPGAKALRPRSPGCTHGIWVLDQDVPVDRVRPLAEHAAIGWFEESVESGLRADPDLVPGRCPQPGGDQFR